MSRYWSWLQKTGLLLVVAGALVFQGCAVERSLDETNEEVRKSNQSTESVIEAVRKTNEDIERMIEEIKQANEVARQASEATRHQVLAFALAEMFKPENTRILEPPVGMMPSGQVYAAEATQEEIAKLIALFIKEIEHRPRVPSSARGETRNEANETRSEIEADSQWPSEVLDELNESKREKLMAAMIIAGTAPADTIQSLIQHQINEGGRYETTAYGILMLRYHFISHYLLREGLLLEPLVNPGLIAESVAHAEQLALISGLPYVDRIQFKTSGLLAPENNIRLSILSGQEKDVWMRIDRAFDADLLPQYKNPLHASAQTLQALRAKVKLYLDNEASRHSGDSNPSRFGF